MAAISAILPVIKVIGTVLSVVSSLRSASIAEAQAKSYNQIAAFEAAQLEQQAQEEQAVAQRKAHENLRKSRLMQSRALAIAASSGGGAMDPTVVKIIADLAGEGSYRAGMDLYEGESRARSLKMGAQARRLEGQAGLVSGRETASAYRFAAGSTLLTGVGQTLADKYGRKKPTDNKKLTLLPELPGLGSYN